jgi:hypothetical protein
VEEYDSRSTESPYGDSNSWKKSSKKARTRRGCEGLGRKTFRTYPPTQIIKIMLLRSHIFERVASTIGTEDPKSPRKPGFLKHLTTDPVTRYGIQRWVSSTVRDKHRGARYQAAMKKRKERLADVANARMQAREIRKAMDRPPKGKPPIGSSSPRI